LRRGDFLPQQPFSNNFSDLVLFERALVNPQDDFGKVAPFLGGKVIAVGSGKRYPAKLRDGFDRFDGNAKAIVFFPGGRARSRLLEREKGDRRLQQPRRGGTRSSHFVKRERDD
jgi:hypothetical protein